MWARAVKTMLGLWLMLSPLVIGYGYDGSLFMWNDLIGGALIVTLALLSCWRRARRAALLTVPIAIWIAGYSYFGYSHPRPGPAQNEIALGILILMFAIIPLDSSAPPPAGMRHERRVA